MFNLCAPALIYVVFSLTHIIIDTFKGLYNTAFFKFIVSILVTILLDLLCKSGMGIVSWFIVFIPFIFMTFIVSILLYVFGLDIATGKLNLNCTQNSDTNSNANIVVSTPAEPILYTPPPHESDNTSTSNSTSNTNTTNNSFPPNYTTDPAYQS